MYGDQRRGTARCAAPARTARTTAPAALATALLVALALLPAATPQASAGSWIIDADTVRPTSARVVQHLPVLDAVVVTSPVAVPGGVPADVPLRPQALLAEPLSSGQRLDSGVATVRAADVWPTTTGQHAVVALIDTGVAPVPALLGAVAGEIDFSGTGGGDGYGHGTFMASVIAGRGQVAPGVAPGAGILSLKVAGPDGSASIGAVLRALQWLHGPGRSAGIRVAALAFAVDRGTEAAALVDRAVDRLAKDGVLVVTATGNDGPGTLTSPATAAGSVSVGAVDDAGTAARGDDVVAPFSGSGPDTAGLQQPDVVAPGTRVVGSLPPGSVIASGSTPQEDGLYHGSGTSMATAVAAGVAALASSAQPELRGQDLAAALLAGGVLDAPTAVHAALGDPEAAPGPPPITWPAPDAPESASKGSIRWTSIRWTSIRWTGSGWGDETWEAAAWGSIRWTGQGWADRNAPTSSDGWSSIRWTSSSIRWTSSSIRWTSVTAGHG